jgi:hypothetical protein
MEFSTGKSDPVRDKSKFRRPVHAAMRFTLNNLAFAPNFNQAALKQHHDIDRVASLLYQPRSTPAQVAELVDALASGASGRKAVEVRVFSWAPMDRTPLLEFRLPGQISTALTADMRHQSLLNVK